MIINFVLLAALTSLSAESLSPAVFLAISPQSGLSFCQSKTYETAK